jgi:hypothetical protein
MGASDIGWLILFVHSILWDIGVLQAAASILYKDNNACIAMAMAQKPTPQNCHMNIKHHALVEGIKGDQLKLKQIDTTINLANHFTKHLDTVLFNCHMDHILGKIPPTYSCTFDQSSQRMISNTSHLSGSPPSLDVPILLPFADAAA